MPRILPCFLVLCLTALWVGCGRSGPQTYEVSGHVTLGGQPVAAGQILFRAADGSEAGWAGQIVDGRYTLRSTPGKKRVEITATREVRMAAKSASGEPALNFESYIPQKYNSQSELTADVTADGRNQFDFPLQP